MVLSQSLKHLFEHSFSHLIISLRICLSFLGCVFVFQCMPILEVAISFKSTGTSSDTNTLRFWPISDLNFYEMTLNPKECNTRQLHDLYTTASFVCGPSQTKREIIPAVRGIKQPWSTTKELTEKVTRYEISSGFMFFQVLRAKLEGIQGD